MYGKKICLVFLVKFNQAGGFLMKKTILLVSLFVIFAFLVIGCSQKVSDKEILASFDKKQVVKASELEKEISELPEWKQDKYKEQAGREEYLTLMAESRMILQVASEKKLEKNPEIVKQVKEFQDQLIRDELTKREVDDKVKVTDGDIEVHYGTHKAEFVEPEQVVVTEITQKDEAKAKEIMEKIKGGADFTELAKEMDTKGQSYGPGQGNGGKTRPFSHDSYSSAKNFVDTSFNMKPGEMSDILTQPIGQETYYMIVRVDEHNQPRQKELSEVKDDIKKTVETEMKDTRKKQWIDELKKDKKVQTLYDKVPKPAEVKEEAKENKEAQKEAKTEEPAKANEPAKDIKIAKSKEDETLAKIGNQVITISDMDKGIADMPEWKKDKYKDLDGRKKYLDELVEEKLLTLVGTEQKLDKAPEIAKQIKEYRDQLMLKELVKQEVDDKVKVEDADIQKYYDEHKADYVEPEKIVVTEVTLKDEAKAKDIMSKIKDGADFTALAKELDAKGESFGPGQGSGGKTISFSRASYSSAKAFVEATFNLKLGEISDIIPQPMGQDTFYMIARLDERTPSKQKELSEVKDDVQREVDTQKKRERIDQWLTVLKKEKDFKLFLDRIPKYVEKKKEEPQATTEGAKGQEGQKADDKVAQPAKVDTAK
jgi:parvulin-like peptidyl-prolyl isomerase